MEHKDSILEDIITEEVEAPYIQRLMINITNWLIEVGILIAIYLLLPKEFLYQLIALNPFMKYVIACIVIFAFRLICILLAGRTIGMILFRSKYLNNNLLPLSPKERLTAAFLTKPAGIRNYKI